MSKNHEKLFIEEFHDRVMGLFHPTSSAPLTEGEIVEKLKLRGGARRRLRLLLNAMVLQGEIVRIRHDHYALGKPADLITGDIEIMRSGAALVTPADGSAEIFVPRGNLSTAFPHDRVVVRLDPGQRAPDATGRPTGAVIRVLERSQRAIVGTLRATGKFFCVVPIDPAYTQDFYVPDPKGAAVNDRVVVQFTEWPNRHVSPEAEIIEVIGPQAEPSLDTVAIIRHYDLREEFPAAVLREAELAPAAMEHPGERRDFRGKFILTIDPATSRDYDDAISLETDAQGRRVLGVHIADVSHFVKPGSALDLEARCRGNSVYLPDRVLPMLPEQLSNGLCSLRPDEDRLTFSALITFDNDGAPIHSEFCRSLIRSRLRLTYEQVLAVLQSDSAPAGTGIGPEALALLRQTHKLAQQLRRHRFERYALDLDIPEYEVLIAPNGLISDICQRLSDVSHQLIEECMVAANEAVDRELSVHGQELLHRVHEPPAEAKIETLTVQLFDLGFRPGNLAPRQNLAHFLASTRGQPLEFDAKLLVLKSMKRAVYSPAPLGHYGLAKKYYAHFTSPIRRYPDLVVHRILAAYLARRHSPYAHAELAALGFGCSRTEQTADAAEKALIEIKKYRFLEQQLRERQPVAHAAVVVRVQNFGMFVELTRLQLQGLVHVSTISTGFVRFDAQRKVLKAGNVTYAFGDKIQVLVSKVDFDKRQVDFILADMKDHLREGAARPVRHDHAWRGGHTDQRRAGANRMAADHKRRRR